MKYIVKNGCGGAIFKSGSINFKLPDSGEFIVSDPLLIDLLNKSVSVEPVKEFTPDSHPYKKGKKE